MNEIEIKFERENRDGIAVAQSYLIDAARRLGVEITCERLGLTDDCAVTVRAGGDLLSPPTKAEKEVLGAERLEKGERLACQTKLEKAGEIVILTAERKKQEEKSEEEKSEEYRKRFAELPLEKKIADLVRLEAIALGETFNFILNSPSNIVSKIMDVMAEFGLKLDAEAREARMPEEHKKPEADKAGENGAAAKKEDAAPAATADDSSKDEPVEAIEAETAPTEKAAEPAEENKESEAKA
jgi:ferredoxin